MYYCCAVTNAGKRSHNEDAFLAGKIVLSQASIETKENAPFIVGVADGVAGENTGEIASKMALSQLKSAVFSDENDLKNIVLAIHDNLRIYGLSHDSCANMQTTVCALAVAEDGCAYSVNVGDSRMYHFYKGEVRQVTKDQSLVQLLYDAGEIIGDEIKNHAKKHMIFPVLGNLTAPPCPDIDKIGRLSPGEIIIVCTDGVSDYLSKQDFEDILSLKKPLIYRLETLIKHALNSGGSDNLTVAAVTESGGDGYEE